jgi:hypothetical protein
MTLEQDYGGFRVVETRILSPVPGGTRLQFCAAEPSGAPAGAEALRRQYAAEMEMAAGGFRAAVQEEIERGNISI